MSEETETIGPSAARYRLTSSRPIPITHALLLTERVHKALVEHCCTSSTFTGCDSRRRPLKGHGHAYILCESSPSEWQITHVTVYSSSGFFPEEQAALRRLGRVYDGEIPDASLTLMALGPVGGPALGESPLLASSRRWVSSLPFLPARHPRFTRAGRARCDATGLQIDSPEHELRRLIRPGRLSRTPGRGACGRHMAGSWRWPSNLDRLEQLRADQERSGICKEGVPLQRRLRISPSLFRACAGAASHWICLPLRHGVVRCGRG